ncbi:MAG: glucokinase [Wenzhouxiangella sp.]|nr:MAG: glucokinase [Wenzhouxiangella sp.]
MTTESPVLVGDVGGTNARFALAVPGRDRPQLQRVEKLRAAEFASLQQAIRHYLQSVDERPQRAAIAVACPVNGDDIRLVNRAWSFNRRELATILGMDQVLILNDFGAAARAVTALEPGEFELLHGPGDDCLHPPISVIGPGTGMGMALLVDCPVHQWRVVETEGGHASFAPLGSEERRIHDWLAARHGRVSIERALSGSGLAKIHAALAGMPVGRQETAESDLREPADIVAAALGGEDRAARAALARFCAILGSVAGDTALFHGARTVAIAGGIVPRFIPFLKSSAFRERFLDKGRFAAYLEKVSIVVVTHPEPGLLGAALSHQDPSTS